VKWGGGAPTFVRWPKVERGTSTSGRSQPRSERWCWNVLAKFGIVRPRPTHLTVSLGLPWITLLQIVGFWHFALKRCVGAIWVRGGSPLIEIHLPWNRWWGQPPKFSIFMSI